MSALTEPTTRTSFIASAEIFSEASKPFRDDYGQRCLRVSRMVAILHGMGFHGLRVYPYQYPLAYRIDFFFDLMAAEIQSLKERIAGSEREVDFQTRMLTVMRETLVQQAKTAD